MSKKSPRGYKIVRGAPPRLFCVGETGFQAPRVFTSEDKVPAEAKLAAAYRQRSLKDWRRIAKCPL